jgi:hypothetical protein
VLGGENVKITPTTTHMTKKATPVATVGDIQAAKPWASKGPQNPPMKHGHQRHIELLPFDRLDSEVMDYLLIIRLTIAFTRVGCRSRRRWVQRGVSRWPG